MNSRLTGFGLLIAMTLALCVPTGAVAAHGGDAPPRQQTTLLTGSGETTRSIDQSGVEVFAVQDGYDLDQYLYRSSSPLDFSIQIERDYGPVDANGHPAPGNPLFAGIARITLRAFDVDESYVGTDVQPEIDRIRVNGVEIDGQLTGADGQWSISTFSFPAVLLKLATTTNAQGVNEFDVLIDKGNAGADVWAVQIDWAELRPVPETGARPIALVHGLQGGSNGEDPETNDMSPFRSYLELLGNPELEGRVTNPLLDSVDSIQDRSGLLQQPLEELLTSTGAPNVNVVAHSYGGLVARQYAWDHRGEVNGVVMVSAPNGGVEGTDILCFLDGSNSDDSWCQLREDYVRNTFNKVVLDHDEVTYVALASELADQFGTDGVVTVESAEWLSRSNVAHPGKHETRALYRLEHGALIDEDSPVFQDIVCEPSFYPDADVCPVLTAGSSALAAESISAPTAFNHAEEVVVPAKESIAVPLAFEGATGAVIRVIFDNGITTLNGSFAGAVLDSGEYFKDDSLIARVNAPADSNLTITNSGTSPVSAIVLVEIDTSRSLDTTVTPTLAAPGQPVSIAATLLGANAGDTVEATITDSLGNHVQTVELTSVGGGEYHGELGALPAGTYSIDATSSPPTRWANSILRVASGGVKFAGGFTEALTGTADGLADALVIRPAITVTTPGRYAVSARLVDANGGAVATAGTVVDLAAGNQSPEISFDGRAIFASGQAGPYRVVDAVIAVADPLALEAEAADLGATNEYSFGSFDHFPVRFDLGAFDDVAVDSDGNGLFDELRVSGSVDVDIAGQYAINAQLRSADRAQIAEFQTTMSLVEGSNSITLAFDGEAVGAAGLDGPYAIADLSIYSLSNSSAVGYLVSPHTTGSYLASQFEGFRAPAPDFTVSLSAQRPWCQAFECEQEPLTNRTTLRCRPPSCGSQDKNTVLTGSGTATAGTPVSVEWRLYGVDESEQRTLLQDWRAAVASDGAFDEASEAFTISDSRYTGGLYDAYDVEIRAVAGGQTTARTTRVAIDVIGAPDP